MNKLVKLSMYISPVSLLIGGGLFMGQYGLQKAEKQFPNLKLKQFETLNTFTDAYYKDNARQNFTNASKGKSNEENQKPGDQRSNGDSPLTHQMNKWARGVMAFVSVAGAYNGIKAGADTKQPSMVLSCLSQMVTWPLYLTYTPQQMQGLDALTIGMFDSGFANHLHNEYGSKGKGNPIGFSLKPLHNSKALNRLALVQGKKSFNYKWVAYAKQTLQFVIADQKRVFTNLADLFKKVASRPLSEWPQVFKKHSSEIIRFLRDPKHVKTPFVFRPHANMLRLGTLLLYVGSIPLILEQFISSKNSSQNQNGQDHASPVVSISKTILGVSYTLSNLPRMATGWAIHDTVQGKALLVGVPISIVGTMLMNNLGVGMGQLGAAANHYYNIHIAKK